MSEKLSTAALRKSNRRNVYQYFYHATTPKTKQDVARDLHLSLPTITQNLQDLMDEGRLVFSGLVESTGGRRPRAIQLVPNIRFAVGVELSPKHVRIVAINLLAQEIAFECIAYPFCNKPAYYHMLSHAVEKFLDAFSLDRSKLLGVGIAIPGIVRGDQGVVEIAPVLGLHKFDLAHFNLQCPYPIFVQNDASAGGYAEWWNADNVGSVAYMFLGKGVGGAVLINGKSYAGQQQRSGEFGHMCIVPHGALCSCGKRGCLEAYCSIARLTDDFDCSIEDFFARLRAQHPIYQQAWTQYLNYLAIGIDTIRMTLDCDVILGGLITPYLQPYLPMLHNRLSALNSFGEDGSYLHLGQCSTKASCIGVALHFVNDYIHQ